MTKLPPISSPNTNWPAERPAEGARERPSSKAGRPEQPASHAEKQVGTEETGGAPIPIEADMTQAELRREAEKRVESQLAATSESEEDSEEKQARDRDIERQEAAHNKDAPLWSTSGKQAHLKKNLASQTKGPQDGFELELKLGQKEAERLAPSAPIATPNPTVVHRPGKPPDPMALLNQAQPPGVYFREDAPEHPLPTLSEDPELLAAVEEASTLLREVRGIQRVAPGQSQEGDSVVLVVAERGFGEASMRQVPPLVRKFPTLVAIPYDLLPLRRER